MRDHVLAAVLRLAAYNPGTGTAPPGATQLETIISWIAWIATAACVVGVLMVAATMAIRHQRGEGGQHLAGLVWVLVACILIGTASALVGQFA